MALLTSAVVGAAAVTGCGSSASHSTASKAAALVEQCTNIADVLSDGPDPNADPVGYAEAQVLPLEQLKFSDSTLRQEVQQLAAAYKTFSSTNGKATAAAVKVSAAEAKIDDQCPQGLGTQLLPGQAVP